MREEARYSKTSQYLTEKELKPISNSDKGRAIGQKFRVSVKIVHVTCTEKSCGPFYWYWEPIQRGLRSALRVLDICYEPFFNGDDLVSLSAKLTSLTTLRVESFLEVHQIRSIVQNLPQLERIKIHNYTVTTVDEDEAYAAAVIPLLARLERLRDLSFNGAIGSTQLIILANSPGPLEEISLEVKLDNEIPDTLEMLLSAKKSTLKGVRIRSAADELLAPSDKIIELLSSIPYLERIVIDFHPIHKLSSSSVEKLLRQCAKLKLTSSLEALVAGNYVYHREFRARLERVRDEEDQEMIEDILGV